MTFGSLFAGVGGFDLGLEAIGMECRWQVEIDPFSLGVIERRWPHVRRHDDVRTFPPADGHDYRVDLICGGFPCQDISLAGRGAGIDGPRSGLWREFARVLRLLRPRYVVVENSPALANRGLDRVLGTLADLGYDADWGVLPASAFGARHIRARMFIIAHPHGQGPSVGEEHLLLVQQPAPVGSGWWAAEPDVVRVVDGFPGRVDRVRALGNAVVPAVARFIGGRIMKMESDALAREQAEVDAIVAAFADDEVRSEVAGWAPVWRFHWGVEVARLRDEGVPLRDAEMSALDLLRARRAAPRETAARLVDGRRPVKDAVERPKMISRKVTKAVRKAYREEGGGLFGDVPDGNERSSTYQMG